MKHLQIRIHTPVQNVRGAEAWVKVQMALTPFSQVCFQGVFSYKHTEVTRRDPTWNASTGVKWDLPELIRSRV